MSISLEKKMGPDPKQPKTNQHTSKILAQVLEKSMNSTSDKGILKNVVSLEKKLSTVLLQNFQTFKFVKKKQI